MFGNTLLSVVLEYVIVFIILFLLQYLLFGRKNNKKYNKKNVPAELFYLMTIYKIDVKKVDYPKFVRLYCLVNSFIMATIYIIVMSLIKNIILKIVLGIVLLFLLTIICYGIVGRYYRRKGMRKDV